MGKGIVQISINAVTTPLARSAASWRGLGQRRTRTIVILFGLAAATLAC